MALVGFLETCTETNLPPNGLFTLVHWRPLVTQSRLGRLFLETLLFPFKLSDFSKSNWFVRYCVQFLFLFVFPQMNKMSLDDKFEVGEAGEPLKFVVKSTGHTNTVGFQRVVQWRRSLRFRLLRAQPRNHQRVGQDNEADPAVATGYPWSHPVTHQIPIRMSSRDSASGGGAGDIQHL